MTHDPISSATIVVIYKLHVKYKCYYCFFVSRKGDYYRYLTEITQGEERKDPAKKALDAYTAAKEAASNLSPTHPIGLGLALNFSVFYYEILDSPDEACRLAKAAFDGAVGELDKSAESQYKESTLILQLLRDNLTLWTSEMQEEGENNREVSYLAGGGGGVSQCPLPHLLAPLPLTIRCFL